MISGSRRTKLALDAALQLEQNIRTRKYDDVNTLALQVDTYHTIMALPKVVRVDITFNLELTHVLFKVFGVDGDFMYMCFPCTRVELRVYELTFIINMAWETLQVRETNNALKMLLKCRERAAELCAVYTSEYVRFFNT